MCYKIIIFYTYYVCYCSVKVYHIQVHTSHCAKQSVTDVHNVQYSTALLYDGFLKGVLKYFSFPEVFNFFFFFHRLKYNYTYPAFDDDDGFFE